MIKVFRAAYVTHLEIIRDSDTPATDLGEDWTAVLRAFPHLTHLTASGPVCPSGVVEALGAAVGHGVTADSDSVSAPRSPLCPALRYVTLGWAVPREIGLKGQVGACDPETYLQHRDVGTRVERRCSAMQLAFERRASMTAQKLDALEFYEYERQGMGMDPLDGPAVFGELIASSRRGDNDLLCLKRLRTIVGGSVVYRGYLARIVQWRYRRLFGRTSQIGGGFGSSSEDVVRVARAPCLYQFCHRYSDLYCFGLEVDTGRRGLRRY